MASQGVSEEAKQHWRNGNALFEENKYAEAVAEFSLAIKTDPEYSDAYFNRGLSERLLQDFEASKQDFEHVLALEQNSPDAMVLLGDISEEMGNMLEAKQWYEKALIAKPDYAEAKTRLDKVNEILSGKAVVPPGSAAANVDVGGETVIEEGQIKKVAFYKSNMRFDSVIGMNKTKKYLTDNIILAMQHPELFKKYGKKQGLGLILYGPPGTGKTFIVNAISGESGANVIIARINQIIDMYSGNTEKNLHAIFEQARQNPPCIIFFDELDALGVKRGGGGEGAGGSAMRLAVNQFLVEMNGLESNPGGIFVIGATNNPWDIDPALKRSGRFGDRIYISPPDYASRKSLFDFYTKHTPRQNLDFDRLARATMGFSGADIAALCDKAIMTPLLHEFESKKERKLSTKDLLDILKDKDTGGSSLDEWYFMVKKEVISTTETQIVNGKKQVTVKEGKLSAEEKVLYKTMVNDIKKNTNPFIIFIKKFMRFFALYIF